MDFPSLFVNAPLSTSSFLCSLFFLFIPSIVRMPRISFRIRPAVGFFHHEKASRMKKRKEKRREREDREDRYSIQGESSGEELDSRIFFASVTRRPGSGPSNQSTGPQSNSRRFTEIMDGRKQLDPRQRTPNKYRSDEIEDTQRNRDEERGNGEREGDSMVRWPDAKK